MVNFTEKGYTLSNKSSHTLLHSSPKNIPIPTDCEYEKLIRVVSNIGQNIINYARSKESWGVDDITMNLIKE